LVFIKKKSNETKFKKNRNRFKPTGSVRFVLVFRTKTSSNRFGSVLARFDSVFSIWLGLDWFFSGLAWFFQFRFGSIFLISGLQTETELVGFFKILIGFFHGSVFSVFFFGFLSFLVFLLTPNFNREKLQIRVNYFLIFIRSEFKKKNPLSGIIACFISTKY